MKRKHADRLDWHRILNRDFVCSIFDEDEFKGHITLISIHQVKEPLIRTIHNQEICLVDDGYYWLQHFPSESNYCVTTMINEKKEVIQWYFDIAKSVGSSEQGIPYWDDLFLDVVVFPNGEFYIKDEDELEEAFNNNHINAEDYKLAKNVMNDLIKEIETMENTVIKNSMNHFKYILKGSQGGINNFRENIMIETKRCRLTRIQEQDYEDVKQLYINHLVRMYLGGTIDDEFLLREKFRDILNRSNSGSLFLVIRSIDSNEFIGLISLDKYHDGENTEISYEFLPQWWGGGLATEVIGKLIDYAFNDLELFSLVAETQTANKQSCRLLQRVGMTLENKLHRFGAEQSLFRIERSHGA